MENPTLTKTQAYEAMYDFILTIYHASNSEDLAVLLGSMSTLPDGGIADPAMHEIWSTSVDKAIANEIDTKLDIR